jgi:EpsI family protein
MISLRLPWKNVLLLLLMMTTAGIAWALRPHILIADLRPKVDLEELVPRQFGDWREFKQSNAQIINPQEAEMLSKLYSQTLTRTYVSAQGQMVMLSIAYGANQSDAVQLHYPEICYPAQGFQVQSNVKGVLDIGIGIIPVKRLMTALGTRSEPVTYWTTIGDQVVRGGLDTKFAQMRHGFKGEIPDGLLFRVSSINRDPSAGHELQGIFARQLILAMQPEARTRFVGIAATSTTDKL